MNSSNEILHPFENLSLWKHFIEISKDKEQNITLVKKHIEYTVPLLDDFKKAFPKYTLHNLRHQQNIVRIIGELLGDNVEKLSSLECAILILSAVYHDIGMVFKDIEIDNIQLEEEFKKFIEENIKAKLNFEENHKVAKPDLVEWYCRWSHAKRVWLYLNKFHRDTPLVWGQIPFKDKLGYVCESHNENIAYIKDDDKFEINFLGECDLKFCAILLRLADILDFDNTRTPLSVYEYLELDNPRTHTESISSDEWNKHLCSDGFSFLRNNVDFTLLFKAAPPHPKIEYGIRDFIKVIEHELKSCFKLLKLCSPRWADFRLPENVDTSGIRSDNYQSGNYHFTLSEEKVLDLLTGEGLYNDEFVFIRELIQNAIDTTRHREFLEKSVNQFFIPEKITVTYFTDKYGYKWVRIDDNGRGMNEEIILNHLLKKGESYYNSDRFKLEKLLIKENSSVDFVPISRFGIGLLSCFIVGDRIEINTKFHSSSNATPSESYRISVEGRNGLFVLQSKNEKHDPIEMPSQYGDDYDYRKTSGTSIAVRLMPNKEYLGFNIEKVLNEYVLCSPIPIHLNGKLIGGDFHNLVEKPWGVDSIHKVEVDFIQQVQELFGIELKNGISIDITTVDVTNTSINHNLKGQIAFLSVSAPDLVTNEFEYYGKYVSLEERDKKIYLKCSKKFKEANTDKEEKLEYEIDDVSNLVSLPSDFLELSRYKEIEKVFYGFYLSHNGIVIHDNGNLFQLNSKLLSINKSPSDNYPSFLYTGLLYFQDELLPNLSVSRNDIKSLNFEIIANLIYSTKIINSYIKTTKRDSLNLENKYNYFSRIDYDTFFSTQDIKKSNFYEGSRYHWDNEDLISSISHNQLVSVNIIKEKLDTHIEVLKPDIYGIFNYRSFLSRFIRFLIQENFDVKLKIYKESEHNSYATLILSKKTADLSEEYYDFSPLVFMEYVNSENTLVYDGIFNRSHPFIKWYFSCYKILKQEFYYYSLQLMNIAGNRNYNIELTSQEVNQILDRLRVLLPTSKKPSEDLNLSEKDFAVEITS